MADLKQSPLEATMKSLAERITADAVAKLGNEVKRALDDARIAAEALSKLGAAPDSILLREASVALVSELEVRAEPVGYIPGLANVCVSFCTSSGSIHQVDMREHRSFDDVVALKDGNYRALFFLVPVKG